MSKEEKMMVLQMVAEGKITPEQGAELLRAVGEGKPEAPAGPRAGELKESVRRSMDANVRDNIERNIERAARQAEIAAEKAAAHAEKWAEKVARHAEDIAEKASREGGNLGKVLGESGENLGKVIARLFSGGFPGGPQFEFHEEVKGQLPAEGEIQVTLSTMNGRITVDTWDDQGFRLDIRKTVNGATEEEAREIVKNGYQFSQDGLCLEGRTGEPTGAFGRNYSIGFTLTLPRDRKASLKLNSSNGRLTVENVSGSSLDARTANGRVSVESCSFSETELDSANGRIGLRGRPGNLRARTANGRIEAYVEGIGQWKMGSANGRVEVEVKKEPGAGYEVDASAVMGRVEVTGLEDGEVLIDETKQKMGSRRYKARTKGYSDASAKASLVASTSMGRVTVSL